MLIKRQTTILKTIVDEFIQTVEPIGSKKLMDLLGFDCSSVTIRNEMAALEDLGLLEETYTSNSRIPSSRGYRFYVENLMEHKLNDGVEHSLQAVLQERYYSVDEIVKKGYDILPQMTLLTSMVLGPGSHHQTLQHVQLFPLSDTSTVAIFITDHGYTENKTFHSNTAVNVEDIRTCRSLLNDRLSGTSTNEAVERTQQIEPLLASHIARYEALFGVFVSALMRLATDHVHCSGQSNILYQPEFADIGKLKELIRMLGDSSLFCQLANREDDIAAGTDGDNELIQVNNVAVVSSKLKPDEDEEGELVVVRPTHMQYSRVVAPMEYMSKVIEDLYRSENQ